MNYSPYKKALTTRNPFAVKADQVEVHAPEHTGWGIFTCDNCGAKFYIGPHRIFGSRQTETQCVRLLEEKLDEDHKKNRPHENSYEFPE